ncbi:two-component system, chemotaxis family, response regulator CheB [Candidatus Kryptobacter tengchongensis]|uniref:Protein-glutamate methylesterase/protein-glutamine glutaminase n=1 Tax=Kryptobacter tengchongensis TaxID=1643429 RepID=A0A656D2C9_KRYT1|nr:chemotaxis response regulator protein-glutamate methylesterase [Candidatus Kryptobacter tengchongensis]CUS97243.1 two-component system, chemotaxis family, response regulator CheB [Candidatus Kryptobacter tengchongensis]CUT01623.1 two-component system, chemotaxis family, response regulator CheB [Candidatus Kryptobacter tengchongensis]CUU09854.1 two-component system, chemotaxis family, response regulator CheB [Candidatus Kryptobacter tengchongensis]
MSQDYQIKVIVVDDSAFMRKSLSLMLESDPQIKVVATARDGFEAIEKIKMFKPDIVTLDVEMPRMDGLTALKIIMKECPVPVLMVSSLTIEGAEATLEALKLGAVDFIPKQLSYVSLDIVKIKDELIQKVKSIATSKYIRRKIYGSQTEIPKEIKFKQIAKRFELVAIGVSTGGPLALQEVLSKIPRDFPAGIVIAQHMPPNFTRLLAERLNSVSKIEVREAQTGDKVKPGLALIAQGGRNLIFENVFGEKIVKIVDKPNTLYKPSVDVMMESAAEVFGNRVLAVIMTGMGKDGLEGLKKVKEKGGYIIAQNEETCVVYGMPKAVVDIGLADSILPLEKIGEAIALM